MRRSRWESPGGPVVRTLCFHCWSPGSIPRWGAEIQNPRMAEKKNQQKRRRCWQGSCQSWLFLAPQGPAIRTSHREYLSAQKHDTFLRKRKTTSSQQWPGSGGSGWVQSPALPSHLLQAALPSLLRECGAAGRLVHFLLLSLPPPALFSSSLERFWVRPFSPGW